MTKFIKIPFIITFAIFSYFFYFHELGLENINEDQLRWYERSENFYSAFQKGDFSDTYQQYHPGIFLIFLIKLGYESFKIFNGINFINFDEIPYHLFPIFNFHTKFFLVLFTILSIILLTYLIRGLYGKFIAISFLVFLMFDTYFIGLTRNLHMDSLLAVVILISIISFYRYLQTNEKKYLIICTIYSGIGILTKSVFLIAFLFQFLISLFSAINGRFSFKPIVSFFLSVIISFSIFVISFPSMWVNPVETLTNIYIKGALSTGLGGDDNFMHYVRGYELPNPGVTFYFHVINMRVSPMILFTILSIIIFNLYIFYKNKKISFKTDPLIVFLILLVISYLFIIVYSSKKTDRYISILYPPTALITAFYLKDFWIRVSRNSIKLLLVFFTFITVIFNFIIHPYYFAFYNPIFGGISEAQKRIYINQGGIGYLLILDELRNYPNKKFSAINNQELKYVTNTKISFFDYHNYKEKNYIKIVPLQRGDSLLKDAKLIKNIEIFYQPFWRIYE
jgi:4-amino-4-deoxy-L-arabinose transferase-like glycosyltransferase